MPLMNDPGMDTHNIPGTNFTFSGKRVDDNLGASEFTLTVLCVDESPSVSAFKDALNKAVQNIVASLNDSPRADSMMLRLVAFNEDVRQIHGFKPFPECSPGDYADAICPSGRATALFDACFTGIESVAGYSKLLDKKDYSSNAIIYIMTDGWDNVSSMRPADVKKAVDALTLGEVVESVMTVLIGVNVDPNSGTNTELEKFQKEAGIDRYISIGDASPKSMAKLTNFVVSQTSSQSQAMGSGAPSQSVAF